MLFVHALLNCHLAVWLTLEVPPPPRQVSWQVQHVTVLGGIPDLVYDLRGVCSVQVAFIKEENIPT